MLNPCEKHVLCPEGTGAESPGVNYSSEHIDVPEFYSRYYPPVEGYGYYTACVGRCLSLVSQTDADLCAQRLGKICSNETTKGGPGGTTKPTFDNTLQMCNSPDTGRLVIVSAGLFVADSQAEANAQALSFANALQKDPSKTPPGPTVIQPPTGGSGTPTPPGSVPKPVPQPKPKPKPPITSQCKPCDDTSAVSSFSVVCNVPADCENKLFESPQLKCGQWKFELVTNDPGSIDDGESSVVMWLAASDPARTPIDWDTLDDCPQIAFNMPCSPGDCSADPTVLEFGFFPYCCAQTSTTCKYAECQTDEDGAHWMPLLEIQYGTAFPTGNSPKKFTVNGTWLGPVPPTP